ncbi:hypothetical protein I317_01538 [Kwoniella heveanensis CBS 569]|nr:hypothetical protein I317_01538 [Kwoniella heveanensis CBS 569]
MASFSPSPSPGPGSSSTSSISQSQIPDITANHLIALPQLLHPLSPALAALHMARLRLALSVPNHLPRSGLGSSSQKAVGGAGGVAGQWCHLCGGLRQGTGGAERRRPSKKLQAEAMSTGPQRRGSGGSGSSQSWKGTGAKGGKGSSTATDTATRAKRKAPECETCGASFKRPKPSLSTLQEFPPARRTRRATRAADAERTTVTVATDSREENRSQSPNEDGTVLSSGNLSKVDPGSGPASAAASLKRAEGDDRTSRSATDGGTSHIKSQTGPNRGDTPTQTATPTVAVPLPTPIPKPKPLLARPSFSYISSSSPNLPTYPKPAPAIPLSSQPQSQSQSLAKNTATSTGHSSGVGAGGSGKRKKKSGLAKLLAENKERQQAGASQGGGMWGLG